MAVPLLTAIPHAVAAGSWSHKLEGTTCAVGVAVQHLMEAEAAYMNAPPLRLLAVGSLLMQSLLLMAWIQLVQ